MQQYEFEEFLELNSDSNEFANLLGVARKKGGSVLRFYKPSSYFPSISITGNQCSLSCAYCNKKFLHHMISATSPEQLRETCFDLAEKGVLGCLISGGYNKHGTVPIDDFLPVMREIKHETGLVINLHPGLVNFSQAESIAAAEVDVVSYDVIGDTRIVREVIGLQKTSQDYLNTLSNLDRAGLSVVPHVGIGFYQGGIEGVKEALEACISFDPELIVLLVFWPKKGTSMQDVVPPSAHTVQKIATWTVLMQKTGKVGIGCMRPRDAELDTMVIQAGISRIELPRSGSLKAAEKIGLTIKEIPACCALPEKLEEEYLARYNEGSRN
ncbi:MAG: radical SAM protein [Candidatus Odinarchaeota archaeon]